MFFYSVWRNIIKVEDILRGGLFFRLMMGNSSLWHIDWMTRCLICYLVDSIHISDVDKVIGDIWVNSSCGLTSLSIVLLDFIICTSRIFKALLVRYMKMLGYGQGKMMAFIILYLLINSYINLLFFWLPLSLVFGSSLKFQRSLNLCYGLVFSMLF